ncbi:MAG: twin-arginine translocase subunit TatB, partial [Paracoccaceae bacterium]
GPETAALAEKQAARKAAASEAAAKLKSVASGAAELEAELKPKRTGRVRKKADKPAGDAA